MYQYIIRDQNTNQETGLLRINSLFLLCFQPVQATMHQSMLSSGTRTEDPIGCCRQRSEKEFLSTWGLTQVHLYYKKNSHFSYLENNDEKQYTTSVSHLIAPQYHDAATKLTNKVDKDKYGGKKLSTAPWHIHVVFLFVPLEPHT